MPAELILRVKYSCERIAGHILVCVTINERSYWYLLEE